MRPPLPPLTVDQALALVEQERLDELAAREPDEEEPHYEDAPYVLASEVRRLRLVVSSTTLTGETPRTDAEVCEMSPTANPEYDGPLEWVPAYLCRQIGREQGELRRQIEMDTDTIERIRTAGEKAEAKLDYANSMEGRTCREDGCQNLAQLCDGHAFLSATRVSEPHTINIGIDLAVFIRKVFLPRNPRKMRTADPETIINAKMFIDAVEGMARKYEKHASSVSDSNAT